MKKIHVSADREYDVLIDVEYLKELSELSQGRTRVAVVFSESMKSDIPQFQAGDCEFFYLPIPDGEAGKSAAVLAQAWNWLGAAGFTRADLIVGIGGGAVTDFAGYLAASWLRGMDWIAVPTTVAGMVDAAIGGKTGINTAAGNIIIGSGAGTNISSGGSNLLIGADSGNNLTSGNQNICIGRAANISSGTGTNEFALGSNTYYVATNGGPTTYFNTATALSTGVLPATCGFIRIYLNGATVKIPVYGN